MIGETTIAIGNPLGLENSVTVGVISKKERALTSHATVITKHLLRTDAPINPGNSGGALLNPNGELIGINMAVVAYSQSIGLAIAVEEVKATLHNASTRSHKFAAKHPTSKSTLRNMPNNQRIQNPTSESLRLST